MPPRKKSRPPKQRAPRVRTCVWLRDLTYRWTQGMISLVGVAFWRLRTHHAAKWPLKGGALLCANHQSYLDPPLIGSCCPRRMNYLARKTLFDFWPLGWLIRWYEAIPLERDGLGIGGLKEALKRLQAGELVLIFPEGTRSEDGELQPLQPGFVALARRGRVPIVTVAIDGAFDVWSRRRRLPGLAPINIVVGDSISQETMQSCSDEELVALVARGIKSAFEQARQYRRQGGERCQPMSQRDPG